MSNRYLTKCGISFISAATIIAIGGGLDASAQNYSNNLNYNNNVPNYYYDVAPVNTNIPVIENSNFGGYYIPSNNFNQYNNGQQYYSDQGQANNNTDYLHHYY